MNCKKCNSDIPDNSIFCLHCGFDQRRSLKTQKSKTRGNGTGTAYKRGKTWTAQAFAGYKKDKQGKPMPYRPTKGGFATKKEALEYVPILLNKKAFKREVTTLSVLWDNYKDNAMQKLSDGKKTHYKTAFNKIINIADVPIPYLTISVLQETVNNAASTYYTARDIKNLLSHLYKMAVAQGDVNTNLSQFIVLPELQEKEGNPFNEAELKLIWEDYGNGHKITAYILLMIYSGMMPGELFRAEKNMINWEKQQILGCGLKTKKRKQTPIVLADFIVPILKEICDNAPTDLLVEMDRKKFYKEFHDTLERCGISDRTPYACRHTTATALALGNIAPSIIQEVMRHTKFSTTARYIHVDINTAPMLDAVNTLK